MEHSSHAYPLPSEQDAFSKDSSNLSCPQYMHYTAQSPTGSPNQQTRRLQLRNAGFRGPVLPFRRISPLPGASVNGIEPFMRSVNNDNIPTSAEKRTLNGEVLPQSPVNILHEIHKMSTKKKRFSPRPEFGAIFEDDTRQEDASEKSWYNGGSSDCSPAPPAMTPARRNQLRDISLNEKTLPPPSASMPKHIKSRSANRGKLRSTSSETAQYIEHLESELASAHAKLDLQPSPKTSKLRAAKFRSLTTENRNLKHENFEWQKSFDTRVQEERAKRLDIDMELTTSMRMLEGEVEMKNARMAELEWELESMRVRIRDLEGLEAINHNLERRIEALTHLLVQSPTKLDLSSASNSPVRVDPSKRTRPRSMLPRLPTSPGGIRTSLPTVSESSFGCSQMLGVDQVESPEDEPRRGSVEDDVHSPAHGRGRASPLFRRHSGSVEGISRASTSFLSSSVSKHTSMRSTCTFGPIPWASPEHEPKSAAKQRSRMRRFPSGSNSLKPLILPTATDVPVLPMSTPIFPSQDGSPGQDVCDLPVDPAATFLSMVADDSTLPQSGRRQSVTVAQEQTLRALEGKTEDTNPCGSDAMRTSQSPPPEFEDSGTGFFAISADKKRRLSPPRSLRKELEEAEVKQSLGKQAGVYHSGTCEENLVPVDGSLTMASYDPASSHVPLLAAQRRQARDTDATPRPIQRQPPLAYATSHPIKALPSTALTTDHAQGLFSRLTEIIAETKQGPIVLARRLLANAWSSGSKRLGGIGWWLLGLVHATRWRRHGRKADLETAEDRPTSASDRQYSRAETNGARTSEPHCRDYGGTHYQGKAWLSPPHVSRNTPYSNPSPDPRAEPHLFACDHCVEPSSRRSLRLWLQFSMTIVLAVGIAVKHGPGCLLATSNLASSDGNDVVHVYARQREREPLLQEQRRREECHGPAPRSDETSQTSRNSQDTNGVDSGYGSITVGERLGRADFKDP